MQHKNFELCNIFNSHRGQQNTTKLLQIFKKNMYLSTNISEAIGQNSSVACYGVWIELKHI